MEQKKENSEEIDLGVLFNILKSIVSSITRPFKQFFKFIKDSIIRIFNFHIRFYYIIIPLVIVGYFSGQYIEETAPKLFSSNMLVKTHFDVKYQIIQNINEINSLISSGNNEKLQEIFKIDEDKIASLKSINVEPALETNNDLLIEFNKYLKNLDSSMVDVITFKDYVSNRELLSGEFFNITVISSDNNEFKDIEKGLVSSFNSEHAIKEKTKIDSINILESNEVEKQLNSLIEFRKDYLEIMKSGNITPSLNFGGNDYNIEEGKDFLDDENQKSLFNMELELRNRLLLLKYDKMDKSSLFEVLSHLQSSGEIYRPFKLSYSLLIVCFTLVLSIVLSFIVKTGNKI